VSWKQSWLSARSQLSTVSSQNCIQANIDKAIILRHISASTSRDGGMKTGSSSHHIVHEQRDMFFHLTYELVNLFFSHSLRTIVF